MSTSRSLYNLSPDSFPTYFLCTILLVYGLFSGCGQRPDAADSQPVVPPAVAEAIDADSFQGSKQSTSLHNNSDFKTQLIVNSIGMKLKSIPAGTFIMGCGPVEMDFTASEIPHQVTLTKSYFMGIHEVTQEQYAVVIGTNPSFFQGNNIPETDTMTHPVENISWEEARIFCQRLSELPEEKQAGRSYRLPTEAEWERACRAETQSRYCCGNEEEDLREYAWFDENAVETTHPVGTKKSNSWGLYDMHGNVFEWCADSFDLYTAEPAIDPLGTTNISITARGGSWATPADECLSCFRMISGRNSRSEFFGFRVVMESKSEP